MGQIYNYTATLTKNLSQEITGGLLVIGETYKILNYVDGDPIDNFVNVADVISGTINTNDCVFTAIGTTPKSWVSGSTLLSAINPVTTVLDTNCDFTNWSTIENTTYRIDTNLLLDSKKTIITLSNLTDPTDSFTLESRVQSDPDFDFGLGVEIYANGFTYQGIQGTINGINLVKSDNLLIYGLFDSYKGIECSNIIIVSSTGSVVDNFNGGFTYKSPIGEKAKDLYVNEVKKQLDGKLLIVGDIGTYNQMDILGCIVRLNTDGSLDTTFKTDGFVFLQDTIHTIDIQKDGKILVGGSFTVFSQNGKDYHSSCILRLNTDGTIDQTFNISSSAGFDAPVNKILIQPDDKILVGGEFSSYNKNKGNDYFIRLNSDGSLDTIFNQTKKELELFNGIVYSISLQSDGKILIGGESPLFTRLNSDATLDINFDDNIGIVVPVRTSSIQSDGKILVGGETQIKRLNIDGTFDESFGGFDPNKSVISILENKGKIYFGGGFNTISTHRDNIYPNSIFSIDNTSYISLITSTQSFNDFGIDIKIYE